MAPVSSVQINWLWLGLGMVQRWVGDAEPASLLDQRMSCGTAWDAETGLLSTARKGARHA
jgi:hypothetical protein